MAGPTWVNIPISRVNLTTLQGALRCDAFYAPYDKTRHVVVGTKTDIYEVHYSNDIVGAPILNTVPSPPVDVAGTYGKTKNALINYALFGDGSLTQIIVTEGAPKTVPSVAIHLRISTFFNLSTNVQHMVTLGNQGSVKGFTWDPANAMESFQIDNGVHLGTYGIGAIADVAGLYSSDDKAKHAIVAGFDGTLYEDYWFTTDDEKGNNKAADALISHATVGVVPGGATNVAAFYNPDKPLKRRILASGPKGVYEFAYDPKLGVRAAQLTGDTDVVSIGGFYSTDDKVSHAILLHDKVDGTQTVEEVYYEE
jgi:hypothetical protein